MYIQEPSVIKVQRKEEVVVSVKCYWTVKRNKNQEDIRPGKFFTNDLKIAFSVVQLEWGVGQKLDWEGSENKG